MNEFYNSYTASIFCFAFKMSILDFIELKNNFKKSITIPKGTQYGFFSSFNGSGSMFDAETKKEIILPKVDSHLSEYDCIDLIADIEQTCGLKDVYGDDSFITEHKGITTK